ncbi:MAG: hypothetical protein ACP5H1_07890 [Acidilobus sp.]
MAIPLVDSNGDRIGILNVNVYLMRKPAMNDEVDILAVYSLDLWQSNATGSGPSCPRC